VDVCHYHYIQSGSGAHPNSYPTGSRGQGTDYSPSSSSATVKNVSSYISLPIHLHSMVLNYTQWQIHLLPYLRGGDLLLCPGIKITSVWRWEFILNKFQG